MKKHYSLNKTLLALICSSSFYVQATELPLAGDVETAIAPFNLSTTLPSPKQKHALNDNEFFSVEEQEQQTPLKAPVASPEPYFQAHSSLMAAEPTTITPMCPTLNTGSLYTINNAAAGNAVCYHFEITERSKTTALLVGQNAQTNVDLTIFRHNNDDSLAVVGASNNAANANESVLALTEPGHYYWYMEVVAADGSPFNFGAAVTTGIDQYELNDTVSLSTALPDKQNRITASLDSTTDVDYYHFTAVRGQDTVVSLQDAYGQNEWILELYNGGWQPLESTKFYTLNNLQPNQTINVRVKPNPAVTVDPTHQYKLVLGTAVARLSSSNVDGESNVTRMSFNSTPTYMTTQAYKRVYWGAKVLDSKGQPVEGAEIILNLDKRVDIGTSTINYTPYPLISDSHGQVSGLVELGTCSGDLSSEPHYEYKFGTKNWWQTSYNFGVWNIDVSQAKDVGVGGPSVPYVTLGHLCRQTFLYSE